MGAVECFDFLEELGIIGGDKVDGSTLPSECSTSSDSVDVLFFALRKVVVDDQMDLLDVNSSGQKIS